MSFEYEGEYWFDPVKGKLRPRWVWPCADASNPDNEYILGHMHKATSGPGSGKLVTQFTGESDLVTERDGISVQDCSGGIWTGYNKKVDGKLKPYLTLPGDTIADVSSECDCETFQSACGHCTEAVCDEIGPCGLTWEDDETPIYICIMFNDIRLSSSATKTSEEVNASFVLTHLQWWYDNDHDNWPNDVFYPGDQRPPTNCRWGYWNEESMFEIRTEFYFVHASLTYILFSYKPGYPDNNELYLSSFVNGVRCGAFVEGAYTYYTPIVKGIYGSATLSLGSC